MKYRNTRTGAIIEVASVISGDDWEKVQEKKTAAKKPTNGKKAGKSKEG